MTENAVYVASAYNGIHKFSLPKIYLSSAYENITVINLPYEKKDARQLIKLVKKSGLSRNIICILTTKSKQKKVQKYIIAKSYQEKLLHGRVKKHHKNTEYVWIGTTLLHDTCLRRIANEPYKRLSQLGTELQLRQQLAIQFGYGCTLITNPFATNKSCSFAIISNEICTSKDFLGWKFQISINHDQLEQAWDLIVPLIVKHKVPGGKYLEKNILTLVIMNYESN